MDKKMVTFILMILIAFQSVFCLQNDCLGDNCTEFNSIDLPLIDKITAPLKAELDITTLHKQIRTIIKKEVQDIKKEVQDVNRKLNLTWMIEDAHDKEIPNSVKTYGFHVQLTNHVSLGSSQVVVFDKVITNIGDAYNPHTGIFTAKTDGLYYFSSTFLITGSKHLHLQMVRNTEEISRGHTPAPGGSSGSMNAFTFLKKKDVVYVRHYPGGSQQTIHGSWSFFTEYLVS